MLNVIDKSRSPNKGGMNGVMNPNKAQYVTRQKKFTSKFSYLLFSSPTHKIKIGLQIGGRLLIANHLHQSL